MNFDDPERQGFANISDAVEDLVKGVVHVELEGKHYAAGKVKTWSETIVDSMLKKLKDLDTSFKYCVTCVLMQKNGAGLTAAFSAWWDRASGDGCAVVAWESEFLHAIVTVYGCTTDIQDDFF